MTPNRRKGLILVAFSALLFSTPGLFTRGVSASGWDVIFWRGLFGIGFTLLFLVWRGTLKKEVTSFGAPAWLASCVWASGAIAYIQTFKHTSIANVALIYGTAPMLSALVAWLALKEKPTILVLCASVLAFLGVAVVAFGSLGGANLLGDALALWMTVTVAIQFAIFRKHPNTPTSAVMLVSTVIAMLPALLFGSPMSVQPNEILLLAVFGAVFMAAATLLMEGSKLLSGGETALISNLEIPAQPVLAFLIFAEIPPLQTFLGGALIVIAILVSQWPRSSELSPKA